MRLVLSGLGVLAALVFVAASGAMNWVFLSGQGKTPLEAQILGAVSLATDAMKALAPFFIASAWRNRRWLQAAIGGAVFAACLVFSLFSALGFAAGIGSHKRLVKLVNAMPVDAAMQKLIKQRIRADFAVANPGRHRSPLVPRP